MIKESGLVEANESIASGMFIITIEAPGIAAASYPGQFVHLRINDNINPLLRRPFSIHKVDRGKNSIQLLYKVVGDGTKRMRLIGEGDTVDLIGPLGNGFNTKIKVNRTVLIGGGMGIAPLFFLADELQNLGKEVILFWGARAGQEIFLSDEELGKLCGSFTLTSEDGTRGAVGMITDPLKNYLADPDHSNDTVFYCCGPRLMLKELAQLAQSSKSDWYASLEERMACGIGVCQGCAVLMKNGEYKLVCVDGPVINLKEIYNDG